LLSIANLYSTVTGKGGGTPNEEASEMVDHFIGSDFRFELPAQNWYDANRGCERFPNRFTADAFCSPNGHAARTRKSGFGD
jgi:hypothetical protein